MELCAHESLSNDLTAKQWYTQRNMDVQLRKVIE